MNNNIAIPFLFNNGKYSLSRDSDTTLFDWGYE